MWRKARASKSAPQFAVGAHKHVGGERRGDPLGVVVGRQHDGRRRPQRHAHHHQSVAPELTGPARQEGAGVGLRQVAYGGAREESRSPQPGLAVGQLQRLSIVGADRADLKLRIGGRHLSGKLDEVVAGDVDGFVGRGPLQGVEQQPRLLTGTRAKLQQGDVGTDSRGDLAGLVRQDFQLGARRIVFRQLADAVEKLRAGLIIEKARRYGLARRRQPRQDRVQEALLNGGEVVQAETRGRLAGRLDDIIHFRPAQATRV